MIKPLRCRRKPLEVDVYAVSDLLDEPNFEDLPEVFVRAYDDGDIVFADGAIFVETGDGDTEKAEYGDYIAVGRLKTLMVLNEERLNAFYEPVEKEGTDGRDVED